MTIITKHNQKHQQQEEEQEEQENYNNYDTNNRERVIFERKIEAITSDLIPRFKSLMYSISEQNALIICDYLIGQNTEINPSPMYRRSQIQALVYFSKYIKNVPFKEIKRDDIINYLDSLRKPEEKDPLHKWIGTQKNTGDITAASEGQPFGGEKMGTITIDSDGRRTNVSADMNTSPNEGNVYEGWLVDAEGSGYKLSLGQFRNGTLDFSQYMVNPYTYKNFELTEEPAEDPDPNAAESIAGYQLQIPFGR